MTEEQINEVMRLVRDAVVTNSLFATGQIADMSIVGEAKHALEAYLRTIGEPAGYAFPPNSTGAKKFAQFGGGFTPVGLVFSKGESAMAISEHGRVYWDRNLVHPVSGEPESVNAELMVALKAARVFMQHAESCGDSPSYNHEPDACGCGAEHAIDFVESAIARAESAIETPAKGSPCAGHAVQLPDPLGLLSCTHPDCGRYEGPRSHECRAMADNACARPSICQGHAVQQEAEKDAARYRWLRDEVTSRNYEEGRQFAEILCRSEWWEDVDSDIDAAMQASIAADIRAQQEADEQPRNILLEVAGKSFCCSCGCNVFQKLDPDNENEYTCNACHATYEAGGA